MIRCGPNLKMDKNNKYEIIKATMLVLIAAVIASVCIYQTYSTNQLKINCKTLSEGRVQGNNRATALLDSLNLQENSSNRVRIERDKTLVLKLPEIKC